MSWEILANKFLDWLERVLPSVLAALGIGYSVGKGNKREVEAALIRTKYELEKKKNVEKVGEKYAGKLPKEIVDDFIKFIASKRPPGKS